MINTIINRGDAETQRERRIPKDSLRAHCASAVKGCLFVLILTPYSLASEVQIPKVKIDHSEASVKRGEEVFKSTCQTCHSLKYLGLDAMMAPDDARAAFGKVPPDLSLMAKARGRGEEGTRYIYALLVSYNDTQEKNSIFPNIAMPPVFSKDDPDLHQKSKDVAAFLFHSAEPSADERTGLGRYVMGYMVIMTALLYFLNKKTWKGIKK